MKKIKKLIIKIKNISEGKKIALRIGIGFLCLVSIGGIVRFRDVKTVKAEQTEKQVFIDEYKYKAKSALRMIAE